MSAIRSSRRAVGWFVAGLISLGGIVPVEAQDDPRERRVICLGFDGVDPRLVEEFMTAGDLPNLAALAERGSMQPLATTNPAESPVSWAAFSIGANPGKSAIFDFLYRIPDSYVPDIALVRRSSYRVTFKTRGLIALSVGASVALLLVGPYWLLRRRWRRLPRTSRAAGGSIIIVGVASFSLLVAWVPDTLPRALPARAGTSFWRNAGEAGLSSTILQVPLTFPAERVPSGRLLSGLGTPDLRQTWGTFSVYASALPSSWSDPVNAIDDDFELVGVSNSTTGGKLLQLRVPDGDRPVVETFLYGPYDFTRPVDERGDGILEPLRIELDRTEETARLVCQGRSVLARAGEWTDWLELEFALTPLIRLHGVVRFLVRSVDPEVYIYASPINFHPAKPPLLAPLSAPRGYSNLLTRRTGRLHETLGWAIATNPLKDELIDDDEFLQDLQFTFRRRWEVLRSELAQDDWRLFVGVLLATDRVSHMFWRHRDPDHPLHDPDAPRRHRDAIREVYREMDRIVGEVMAKHLDDRTDLHVLSDHGFASFRKQVHLNSWLIERGYLVVRESAPRTTGALATITERRTPFGYVDWSKSVAYSLGLGKIYLNRMGREPEGIVDDANASRVETEIIDALKALRDPDDGRPVVRQVYRRDQLYAGPHVAESADLVVGFEAGYRVSWDTAAGAAPPGIIEPNLNKWSGDHCSVDPSLVPGVLISSRRVQVVDPSIVDMARSILTTLEVPIPPEMEGRPVFAP